MFQIDEYFKEKDIDISTDVIDEFLLFSNQILNILLDRGIQKFTFVLDSDTSIEMQSKNDSGRVVHERILANTMFGSINIELTSIEDVEYSAITIVYLQNSTDRWNTVLNYVKDIFSNNLPCNYVLNDTRGSLYMIVSKNILGKLWNVHSDPQVTKAHIVLTECDEDFVWYNNNQKQFTLSLRPNKFYMFNVNTYHTVFVNNYVNELPRIHLVGDIVYVQ